MEFQHGGLEPPPIIQGDRGMGAIETWRVTQGLFLDRAVHINAKYPKAAQTPARVVHPDRAMPVENLIGWDRCFLVHGTFIAALSFD